MAWRDKIKGWLLSLCKPQIRRFAIEIGFIICFIVFLVIEFFVFTTMVHLYGKTQITLAQISVMISGTFITCISAYGFTRPENIRKFFGWLISTGPVSILLKILRWFFFTDGGILVIFLLIALAVAVSLGCFYTIEKISKKPEVARVVVLALGGVAGACGLVLAARRSKKFSEQVDTGQKQLFNEQLGRGAELLTKDQKPMRRTGIRILEDLAETKLKQGLSKENIKQAQLIMRIIHDFVHEKTSPPPKNRKKLYTRIAEGRESLDIALGIRTLVSLYNESGKLDELKKLVQFRGCRLEGLDFNDARLQGANFRYARLQGVGFRNAELQKADFDRAELEWADCTNADFLDAKNLTQEQVEVMVFRVDRPPTLSKGLEKSLNKDLCYKWKLPRNSKSGRRHRYFVESKTKWSGKRVSKYLASIRKF